MAVAVDSVGPSSSGTGGASGSSTWTTFTLTWSHTVGASGSNRLLVVGAIYDPGAQDLATLSATYAGVAMTAAGSVNSDNTAGAGTIYLFYLVNPPTGTNSVVVTATYTSGTKSANDAIIGGSISFTGVNQTTPVQNVASNYGSGSSASVVVTSAAGDMVVDALGSGTAGTTTSTQTLQWHDPYATQGGAGNDAQSTAAGASSVTMGYTIPSDWWGMVGMDIVAAAAAAFQPDEDFWQGPVGQPSDPTVTVWQ